MAWRRRWNSRKGPPARVKSLWLSALKFGTVQVDTVSEFRDLSIALIELCAIADEACFSLGIPPSTKAEADDFYFHAAFLLAKDSGATLCERIHDSKARVLPKMHTPQTGLTFRSFSFNLALHKSNEILPRWVTVASQPDKHRLRLLLAPWPLVVKRDWFRRVPGEIKMPRRYGFFEYSPSDGGIETRTERLLNRATKKYGTIDGLILPELALTQAQYSKISRLVLKRHTFLIAGVASAGSGNNTKRNSVHFDLPLSTGGHVVRLRQGKHHRWRLDNPQVRRYRLQHQLGRDRGKFLWEHIELEDRCLYFVTLRPWLTIAVLICEDLARPDPVGDLVRVVGPNLVVTLLLDGPQLQRRWAFRYAAALAEDPGASVIALTSIGMVNLSCPGLHQEGHRVVALWRDGGSGECKTIKVPPSFEGIVLDVDIEEKTEFAADGRSDNGATGYPILKRCRFV
jgi:hypothetical protein